MNWIKVATSLIETLQVAMVVGAASAVGPDALITLAPGMQWAFVVGAAAFGILRERIPTWDDPADNA